MITSVSRVNTWAGSVPLADEDCQRPRYDLEASELAVEISVILPGIASDGLEILLYQDQLIVTARRNRTVRPNWGALRLECAQHDYRLNIRLGFAPDPESVRTELACGILSIRIDRRQGL